MLIGALPLGLAPESIAAGAGFAHGVAARAGTRKAILWTRLPETGRYKWVVMPRRSTRRPPITGGGVATSARDVTLSTDARAARLHVEWRSSRPTDDGRGRRIAGCPPRYLMP